MASNYDDLSKDELVQLLKAREKRDALRLGLIWEANEIEREKAINSDFVVLDIAASLSVGEAPWRNLIIEGDNFDALRFLGMSLAGKVKCISIDPPYNTGEKDFIYNDNYVDKEHAWRHSMWLEFMSQRLLLAREMLSHDGVLLCHIGEDEVYRLGCLLDQIMPGRKVGTFVWRTRSGANDSKEYFRSIDHEYVLCYANPGFTFGGKGKALSDYSNPDNDVRGDWVSSDLSKAHNYKKREGTYYPIQNPDTGIWYPCNPDRVWAYATETRPQAKSKLRGATMEALIRDKKVLWPEEPNPAFYNTKEELLAAIENGTAPINLREELPDLDFWVGKTIGRNTPRRKKFTSELKLSHRPLSSWIVPSADKEEVKELINDEVESEHLQTKGTSEGTALLRRILPGAEFPFPKPLELIRAFIEQTTTDDDIILDFFAGTGTVAHAVLAQNEADQGNRRFILVSSTEATAEEPDKNVCLNITRQRVENVINGYSYKSKSGIKSVEGIEGEFAYGKLRRVLKSDLLDLPHENIWTILQLIHFSSLSNSIAPDVFQRKEDGLGLIYVPRFDKKLLPVLKKAVKASPSIVIYSWQPGLLREHLREEHVQHEAIPESLIRRFGLQK